MRRIILLVLVSMAAVVTYAQSSAAKEKFTPALVQAKSGALLAYSGKTHGFTIHIEADSVRPLEQPGYMMANGLILQSNLVAIPEHLYADQLSEQQQYEILRAYIQYELDYFKKELKIKYSHLDIHPASHQGKPFIIWHFTMPKTKGEVEPVEKQIYLSSVCFNQTLTFNVPLLHDKDFEKSIILMAKMFKTIKTFDHALDLDKLHAEANQ